MAHPASMTSLPRLRRAIAAVLRGGPLPERDRRTLTRLVLEPRVSLRLPVGARVSQLDAASAGEAAGYLSSVGLAVDSETLLRAWHLGLRNCDPFARTFAVTPTAARLCGEDDAQDLATLPLPAWLRGALVPRYDCALPP